MIEYINNRFVWQRTTTKDMGKVYADIELLNSGDVNDARRNNIGEEEIRRISIRPLVDSGADFLCINEHIQEILQLPFTQFKYIQLADGETRKYEMVGPVIVKFENETCSCDALVLPGNSEALLGLIPLESLNVIIDPRNLGLVAGPPARL
jgi:clan AA aspartic protease